MNLDPLVEAGTSAAKPVLRRSLSVGQLARLETEVKRRGSQRGSLTQRAGKWYAAYRRHTTDGAGNLVYRSTTKLLNKPGEKLTKKQAVQRMLEVITEANALSANPRKMATFGQFVEAYWVPELSPDWRESTAKQFDYLMRSHILPTLEHVPLAEITPGIVQSLLHEKGKLYSKALGIAVRDLITHVYKYAKRRGFWSGDIPSEGAKPRGEEPKEQKALSAEQANLIVQLMEPRYRDLVLLLRATGMRIGEAMGLRWKWVNLTETDIMVEGTLLPRNSLAIVQGYSKRRWGKPKTPRSRRVIPLSTMAGYALLEMQELDIAGGPEDPVFRRRNGLPWNANVVARDQLKPAAKKAGVPWAHWHTFRHSLGVLPEQDLQGLLGHVSIQTTRIYRHPEHERVRTALEKLQ